jgi:CRP-like cAMP-binding protein
MRESEISIDALCKIPLLENLNPTECRQIAEIAQREEFRPGDTIMRYGETSQDLWILLEGKCEVSKPRPELPHAEEHGLVLAVLEPYSIFGEMSFFHKAPHSANVRAKTPVQLLRITRTAYDDLIRDGAWGAYKLALNAVASMAQRLRHMDDWVAQLTSQQALIQPELNRESEWNEFRDKMFASWNL